MTVAAATILKELAAIKAGDVNWQDGKLFSLAFKSDDTAMHLAEDAYRMFMWENALDPIAFPSLMKFEKEIIGFAVEHLGGDAETVGTFTSGGTESCCLAVLSARNWAREHRPEVTRPKMIVPVTVHAAFHKAAHYFGLETVIIPVDPETCQADVAAMRAAIDDQTILLVGSAPSYGHGAIDPIADIAALAVEHNLLCHVDGCIGGFVLPFLKELGADVPDIGFGVPGVTSISMDFHKYAYAPKGSSVVLFKNPELRRQHMFIFSAWPGYTMVNPTMQSTRSGGPMAGTWAMLRHYGRDGYREIVRNLKTATERFIAGINAIDGLYVIGEARATLIGVATHGLNVYAICEAMARKGWHIGAQMGLGDVPASFHLTVMPQHVPQIDAFLAALAEVVTEIKARPAVVNDLMGMMGDMDLSSLSNAELEELLTATGLVGGSSSGPTAEVNEILERLPSNDTDRLVRAFYDLISRPVAGVR
jgi:glutamate/tyrosine decarboxylase-like PLP-dependent enzyme